MNSLAVFQSITKYINVNILVVMMQIKTGNFGFAERTSQAHTHGVMQFLLTITNQSSGKRKLSNYAEMDGDKLFVVFKIARP